MNTFLDLVKLVVGALLGYWLGQHGADRQFRRQQTRQRIEDAKKAYVDCLKAGRRLVSEFYLPRNRPPSDLLADLQTDDVRNRVTGLQEQLADAEIALGVHGATTTIGQLQEVRFAASSLLSLAGIFQTAALAPGSLDESYTAAWFAMAGTMDQAEREWEQWKADQEAVAGRWAWLRQLRSLDVWARVRRWLGWQRFRRQQPNNQTLPPGTDVS
ncbi:hypothetical protein [Kutzneria buriramensis]|uniref:Uncharacterized protein n=1 Tax=Kutzneria buriramensis TaxID=1045776 RepID=A0A3E0I9K2_9PSEU|nr:hypothetical protein [Kutzneria buriramensis]REH55236.1 hypothetical protein BCF44_101253 [Kutzneria buriramensis]